MRKRKKVLLLELFSGCQHIFLVKRKAKQTTTKTDLKAGALLQKHGIKGQHNV